MLTHSKHTPERLQSFALSEVDISLQAKSALRSKQSLNFAWSKVCGSLGATFACLSKQSLSIAWDEGHWGIPETIKKRCDATVDQSAESA